MGSKSDLFVGRLHRDVRTRDLEDIFSRYGRLTRCDIKYGTGLSERGGMCYAFIGFEDRRDAEDAIRYENGRDLKGERMVVENARGPRDRGGFGGGRNRSPFRGGGGGRYRSRSRSPVRRTRRSPSYGRRSPSPRRGRSASRSRSPVARRRSYSRSPSR